MHSTRRLTAVTWREENGYVALCPDVDVVSQGDTVQEARANLTEALQLFLETASPAELAERLRVDAEVSPLEVAAGR
jgi:predicted RNase H-like HicB family nuclease